MNNAYVDQRNYVVGNWRTVALTAVLLVIGIIFELNMSL